VAAGVAALSLPYVLPGTGRLKGAKAKRAILFDACRIDKFI
jgi:hypothetical protein